MKVKDLVEKLNLKVVSGAEGLIRDVTSGYTSDLLSDVMGHISANAVWITLQSHKNVIAIASLKDVSAVIVVNDYQPEEDSITQSNEEGIPILTTSMSAFEISAKIFNLLY